MIRTAFLLGLTLEEFGQMSPRSLRLCYEAWREQRDRETKTQAHWIALLMNRMRQSRRDRVVRAEDLVGGARSPETVRELREVMRAEQARLEQ